MNQLSSSQVVTELSFYHRYLLAISQQIDKRNTMRDSYITVIAARMGNIEVNEGRYWD